MKRHHFIWLLVGTAITLLVVWIMRNTYWDEVTLPTSLRGEAARNPLYAAGSLAKILGAQTSTESIFPSPAADAVIFLSDWTWDLGKLRRRQLEQWVEAGGRLIIDNSVLFRKDVFQQWSGVEFFEPELSAAEKKRRAGEKMGECQNFQQSGVPPIAGDAADRTYQVCNQQYSQRVRSLRLVSWALRDRDGMLALRVPVGRGTVTAISGNPFRWRGLLSGEHAQLFVAVTQLHRADRIYFLSEASHPSLLALAWRYGAPFMLLAGLTLLLALWRNGVRFGPLAPASQPLRRSLVEQIRGTGEFALRYGGGTALHAALVRAIRSAAIRRIPGFAALDAANQAAAMAQAGSVSVEAMLTAMQPALMQRPKSLLSTLALLETVRRRILSIQPGHTNGK